MPPEPAFIPAVNTRIQKQNKQKNSSVFMTFPLRKTDGVDFVVLK